LAAVSAAASAVFGVLCEQGDVSARPVLRVVVEDGRAVRRAARRGA
jgi:hypothetical protein